MTGKKPKSVMIIGALTAFSAAVLPPVVSLIRSPSITASGDGSVAIGKVDGNVNIFVLAKDRWLDGAKEILGMKPKDGQQGGGNERNASNSTKVNKVQPPVVSALNPISSEIKKVNVGELVFGIRRIEIRPRPGGTPNRDQWAVMGIDVTNTSVSPVHVAIVPAWPAIQIDGAIEFKIRYPPGVTGLETFDRESVDYCVQNAKNFTRLVSGQTITANLPFETDLHGGNFLQVNSGRISGAIMVYSPDNNSCVKEAITASDIPVVIYP